MNNKSEALRLINLAIQEAEKRNVSMAEKYFNDAMTMIDDEDMRIHFNKLRTQILSPKRQDLESVEASYKQRLSIAEGTGKITVVIDAYHNLAALAARRRDFDASRNYIQSGLDALTNLTSDDVGKVLSELDTTNPLAAKHFLQTRLEMFRDLKSKIRKK